MEVCESLPPPPQQGGLHPQSAQQPVGWLSMDTLSRPLWTCGGIGCKDEADLDVALCGGGSKAGPSAVPTEALQQNLLAAREVARTFLGELREQCLQEKESFERQGRKAPREKQNRWGLYLNAARSQRCAADILKAVRRFPECRMRILPASYMRALVVLQHSMAEDTLDFSRSETERKHCDTFEGFVTPDGVNSQLIKDAHRSEWTVDGRSFTLHGSKEQQQPSKDQAAEEKSPACDRKQVIANFQRDLVTCLEEFLLDFCHRRGLHEPRARQLMQAVTTQMSQAGLANLERASQASSVYVSGQGLEQRTAYNVSAAHAGGEEVLQLSIYCMKTGFSCYHTPESIAGDGTEDDCGGPLFCSPSSYLYQYATVRFCPVPSVSPDRVGGQIDLEVVDLIDEVNLVPVGPL